MSFLQALLAEWVKVKEKSELLARGAGAHTGARQPYLLANMADT